MMQIFTKTSNHSSVQFSWPWHQPRCVNYLRPQLNEKCTIKKVGFHFLLQFLSLKVMVHSANSPFPIGSTTSPTYRNRREGQKLTLLVKRNQRQVLRRASKRFPSKQGSWRIESVFSQFFWLLLDLIFTLLFHSFRPACCLQQAMKANACGLM